MDAWLSRGVMREWARAGRRFALRPDDRIAARTASLVEVERFSAVGCDHGAPGLDRDCGVDVADAAVTQQCLDAAGGHWVDVEEILLTGNESRARWLEILRLARPELAIIPPPLTVLIVPAHRRVVAVAAEEWQSHFRGVGGRPHVDALRLRPRPGVDDVPVLVIHLPVARHHVFLDDE